MTLHNMTLHFKVHNPLSHSTSPFTLHHLSHYITFHLASLFTQHHTTFHTITSQAYPHKYPYDWRTKKPTIFRATEQWFASVGTFRDDALEAIDKVKNIP